MYNTASTPGFASPLKRGCIEGSPPVIKIPFVLLSSFGPHACCAADSAPVPDKPNTQPRTTATTTTAATAPPIARFLLVLMIA